MIPRILRWFHQTYRRSHAFVECLDFSLTFGVVEVGFFEARDDREELRIARQVPSPRLLGHDLQFGRSTHDVIFRACLSCNACASFVRLGSSRSSNPSPLVRRPPRTLRPISPICCACFDTSRRGISSFSVLFPLRVMRGAFPQASSEVNRRYNTSRYGQRRGDPEVNFGFERGSLPPSGPSVGCHLLQTCCTCCACCAQPWRRRRARSSAWATTCLRR